MGETKAFVEEKIFLLGYTLGQWPIQLTASQPQLTELLPPKRVAPIPQSPNLLLSKIVTSKVWEGDNFGLTSYKGCFSLVPP